MSTDPLAARLERLERSLARMKRLVTVLGLLLAGTFMGAMQEDEVPDVIRAREFVAVGKSGGTVTIGEGVFVNDPNGSMVIGMKAFPNGANILMMSPDRGVAISLLAHAPGGVIGLHDEDGSTVALLDGEAGGALILGSPDQRDRVRLSARAGASLVFSNREGVPVCSMISDEEGNGEIAVRDASGARAVLEPGS